MRKYLGQVKMNYVTKQVSKEDTLNILQNIDWSSVEEFEVCTIVSLQTFVSNTVEFINR